MFWIVFILTGAYVLLVGMATYLWNTKFATDKKLQLITTRPAFTLLIPFRNEGSNLPYLLKDLQAQSLDNQFWNCLFVNDHSEDQSVPILEALLQPNQKLIHSQGHGKKAAITSGLHLIQTNYIVQTDADCRVGPHWLTSIYQVLIHHPSAFLTGPVAIHKPRTTLDHFQAMDLMALMGMTSAGLKTKWWAMANGANMAYPTQLLKHTNHSGTGHQFASGDDMFLVEAAGKATQDPILFHADPRAIVTTDACADIPSFIKQRIRWGSKNKAMRDPGIKIALAIPFCFNLMLGFITFVMLFNSSLLPIGGIVWIIKFGIDFMYLYRLAPFFQYQLNAYPFMVSSLIYPFYLSYLAILSIFKPQYEWKGRITQ